VRVLATDHAAARIYPKVTDIRNVSNAVACAVIRAAAEDGVVRNSETRRLLESGADDFVLRAWLTSKMYTPSYVPLVQSHK
jgi:malic enzyme